MDWYNFICDVCAQYFLDHPTTIGGDRVEVEIDESKFGRRKYHRGRYVEGHWVFGGTERITGKSFMVEVDKRDAATLLPIIQQYIRPGSVVYSDEWRAYSQLQHNGYDHPTVNHSHNLWSSCKRLMREEKTMHSTLFETYLPEYLWRRRFDNFNQNSFNNILLHIAEQYKV